MNDQNRTPPDLAPSNRAVAPTAKATLDELSRLIEEPGPVPKVGVDASSAMRRCFETVAGDIDRLAAEHVKRALELEQEAQTFSTMVRGAGERLCAQIEQEALRGYQVSRIMTASLKMMAEPPESGG